MNKGKMNKNSYKTKDLSLLPLILIAAGVLLITGVLFWQANRQNKSSPGAEQRQRTAIAAAGQSTVAKDNKRVSLTDAKAAFDSQSAVFVDVRIPESYQAGHIPGAINIQLNDLANRLNELDPNQWIITYCS